MVTIQAQVGKFYFSDFLVLLSGESKQIDETVLTVFQLKDLLSSIRTKRLLTSTIDLEKIETEYASKNNTGGGGIDPSLLAGKEDKSSKVQVLGTGSATSYPSTAAVKTYVDEGLGLKANQTELDLMANNMSQALVNVVNNLQTKQDKVAGKGLSTNDYTATDKAAVATIKTYDITADEDGGLTISKAVTGNDVSYELHVPRFEDKVRSDPSSYYNQTLVDTVPLYTLTANGEYVLTKPDEWVILNNSNFCIPSYHVSTISDQYAKGIVEYNVYNDEGEFININVRHNITAVITDYIFECDPLYCRITKAAFDGVDLISSTDGSFVNMTLSIPKSTVSTLGDPILSIALAHPDVAFRLGFTTADNKNTATVFRDGFSQRAES